MGKGLLAKKQRKILIMIELSFDENLSKKDFKLIRLALGLSKKELAEKLGVKKRTIDVYEMDSARKIPARTLINLKALVKIFNETQEI